MRVPSPESYLGGNDKSGKENENHKNNIKEGCCILMDCKNIILCKVTRTLTGNFMLPVAYTWALGKYVAMDRIKT